MKRLVSFATVCALATATLGTSGCASNIFPGGPTPAGLLYTQVTSPAQNLTVAVDKDAQATKTGRASSVAILGVVAVGDAGMHAAMNSAGITRVHHVDHTVQLVLAGLFARAQTTVYGE